MANPRGPNYYNASYATTNETDLVTFQATNHYKGWLDEVRLWDHVRSPAELAATWDVHVPVTAAAKPARRTG